MGDEDPMNAGKQKVDKYGTPIAELPLDSEQPNWEHVLDGR